MPQAVNGIQLDNAGTSGGLIIRGPASGLATIVFPDMSGATGLKSLAFNATTGEMELVAQGAVPTVLSAFTNDSGFQTNAQVTAAIQAVVGAAPAALDTLQEIATQLQADESVTASLITTVAGKANTSSLATVATSGSYADLSNKPTIPTVPTAVSAFTNDSGYAVAANLAAVATSGSYADLSNKPTIPTVPTAVSAFTNDSGYAVAATLATVASTGSYADLSNKPTIPTVPTAVSAFTNDSGYAVAATLATVATSGSYVDLTNKPTIPTVPTAVSAFTNDSGYLTAGTAPIATSSVLGGVKIGAGLSVTGGGVVSTTNSVLDGNGNGTQTVVGSVATTDATVTAALTVTLASGKVVLFTADVVGKASDGSVVAGYSLSGVARNVAGTVSFSGGVMKSTIAEDQAAWDANAASGTGDISITVKGAAATNVSWVVAAKLTSIA